MASLWLQPRRSYDVSMFVYCVINRLDGKRYVGQTTTSVDSRWGQHQRNAKHGVKTHFYNAIRKHGVDQFSIEVLQTCDSQSQLDEAEKKFISLYKTLDPEFGYNRHPGGAPDSGYAPTERQKEAMSLSMKARWSDPEFKAKMYGNEYARKYSPQATCHPEKPHYSLGLCRSCYGRTRSEKIKAATT